MGGGGARVEGDSVVGGRSRGRRWAAPLDSVRRVERRRVSAWRTAGLVAALAAAAYATAVTVFVIRVGLDDEPYT